MSASRIIGVDPGLVSTGWGIIDANAGQLKFVACGTINPKPSLELAERLLQLHRDLTAIIGEHRPTLSALEETFVTANGQSTLKLGQARGVLLVTLSAASLPVSEYAARVVKKAVVGTGKAEKEQVSQMVAMLLPSSRDALAKCKHDAADALAIAICHANHAKLPLPH
jgi:crossover junction endodeoxyribonuclease RuvC